MIIINIFYIIYIKLKVNLNFISLNIIYQLYVNNKQIYFNLNYLLILNPKYLYFLNIFTIYYYINLMNTFINMILM
jgi:hypothetical protein